jgi:glycerol-3-phosphate acyltransferase PlsY
VGFAFAGFCLMMGRYYPVFNRFRGSHGCVALVAAALMADPAVGIAAAAVMLALIWFTRYITLGVAGGALIMLVTAVLVVDNRLVMVLTILTAVLALIRHIPALRRVAQGREEKLEFKDDITYKLDE